MRECLIRITEHLQGKARIMQAQDLDVLAILEDKCLLLMAIVGPGALFQVSAGRHGLPQMK